MKKIIILALCAVSFAVAAPKKCVTFADTAGEGCWVYGSCSFDFPYACLAYHIVDEQAKEICGGNLDCERKKIKVPR